MPRKKILILSYSHLDADPRVLRQIEALKKNFDLETAGYGPCGDETIPFYTIYSEPAFSLKRKVNRLFQFALKKFDRFYWDDGKEKLAGLLRKKNYDAVIANDIYTLPLALAVAGKNEKVYFDAHEYHPLEFEDSFKWRIFIKPYTEYLCKKYIPKVSVFTTVCEGIASEYKKFTGLLPSVITNATHYHLLAPIASEPGHIRLIHHGAAIRSRKIELMIEMMEFTDARFTLDLMLAGTDIDYINNLKRLADGNKKIRFVPPVNVKEICAVINLYDMGIFLLPPVNFNYLHALPNKLFEFTQARLGIAVSPNPEMSALVKNYDLGVVAPDYSPESFAKAISGLSTEQVVKLKQNADKASRILSAEENMKKINNLVNAMF